MEAFLDRLSECQLNEDALRQEREALLKRQEQELVNLDKRLVNIASQRNSILEEFKNFLEATPSESNASPSPTRQRPQSFHFAPTSCTTNNDENVNFLLQVERPSSSGGSTPISQYHSPLASPLPEIKAPIPPTPPTVETPPILSPPAVENRRIIRSPIRRQNAETKLPKQPEEESSSRLGADVKPSIVKPSRKHVSSKVLDSPATGKIEKILNQVRSNAHPLEEAAVNHCINLLSSKCEAPSITLPDLETPKIEKSPNKTETEEAPFEAPIRRNALKKRIETPEERRRRIEAVLFGPSPEERKKQELSHSSNAINELGRTQSAIIDHNYLYGGRRSSGNVNMKQQPNAQQTCQLRRNQSLSPLRFGANGRSLESIEDEITDASMEDLLLRAPNVDKRSQMRRAQSDAAIRGDSDSFSAATSFDDDFDFESDAAQVVNASMSADDQDHLLAPSKVAKSQNMFHQSLFGKEIGKRLLTKEEIARSRRLANHNKLAAKRARSFEQASLSSPIEEHDRVKSPTDSQQVPGTLRAEQLVQIRGNSASPDQRQIERELNTVANLKRFQSYQNFWEHKTKEILDKQKRFSTLSGSSDSSTRPSSRSQVTKIDGKTDQKPIVSPSTVKPETFSPRPSKKKTPKSGNSSKVSGSSTSSKENSNGGNKLNSSVLKTSATTSSITNENNRKESKSLLDRFTFFNSSKKKDDFMNEQRADVKSTNKSAFIDRTNAFNNNNGYSKADNYYGNNGNNIYEYGSYGYNSSNNAINNPINSSNKIIQNQNNQKSALKSDIEGDQLLQRVRNIHEDIRQRKLQQQSQSHPMPSSTDERPSIQAAKSLDLQYYALKAKQVPIKLIEPNGPEPGLAKNRFRLIKSGSRDNSTEQSSDDNFDALSQVSFAPTAVSDCSMQHMRPHSRNVGFRETTLHKPMKSTYF